MTPQQHLPFSASLASLRAVPLSTSEDSPTYTPDDAPPSSGVFDILPSSGTFASRFEISNDDPLHQERASLSALGVPRVGANVSANDDVPDAVYTCPLAVVEPAPPPRFAVLLAAAALVVTGVCIGRAIGFFLVAFV